MGLTRYDFDTPTWTAFKALLTERLDRYRKMNDAEMSEPARGKLLGSIAEDKALLALDEQAPIVE